MQRFDLAHVVSGLAVVAICLAPCSVASADLLVYWGMNEGTGTAINDLSGGTLDGTLNGAGSGWTTGKSGGAGDYAIDLQGTIGSYASVGANSILDMPGDFTVSVWAKGPSSGGDYSGWRRLVDVAATGSPGNAGVTITTHGGGGDDTGVLRSSTSPYFPVELTNGATTVFNDTSWYHVAMVRSGTSITSYVNGAVEGDGGTSSLSFNGKAGLFVGAMGPYVSFIEGFQGAMDDFAIWNEALTPGQITNLYNGSASPLTIPEPSMCMLLVMGLFCYACWKRK